MTNGQIHIDNLKDFMDKKFSEESESDSEHMEHMDKINKCVEEGKQRLNWIGKNVSNI